MDWAVSRGDEGRYLLEAGTIRPVIDSTYALARTADTIRYVETGRARGKVVISVARPDRQPGPVAGGAR